MRLAAPGLLAALALAVPAAAAEPDPAVLGRAILGQLIDMDTTHAHGSTSAAGAMAARLLAAGFAPADITLIAPPGKPTKSNLIVRLHGRGIGRPVLFMGHLDVVEAARADWTTDPFHLTEVNGTLFGRGTIDMKGQDTAMLVALIRMKQSGIVPNRDVILMLTADEEAGGDDNGPDFLLRTHPELIRAGFAINPDTAGDAATTPDGRKLFIGVETSEKQYLTYRIEAHDRGGHSSEPTPANPINHVAGAVARLAGYKFPVDMTPTTRSYLAQRATLEHGQVAADMAAAARPHPPAAAIARLAAVPESDAHLRTTCTTTQIAGGRSESALPELASAVLQCRVVPGETQDAITRTLTGLFNDPAVTLSVTWPALASPESPLDPAIMGAIGSVTQQMFPGVRIIPTMTLGASDGAYTRNAGIPTYGVDAMFVPIGDARAHGRDERITVAAFNGDLEFIYRLMTRMADLPPQAGAQ